MGDLVSHYFTDSNFLASASASRLGLKVKNLAQSSGNPFYYFTLLYFIIRICYYPH